MGNKKVNLFRDKNFIYYFLASLIGVLGEGMFGLSTIVLVLENTDSAFEVGKMLVVTLLPSVFLAPFIGVLIDKVNKLSIAYLSNLIRFFSIFLIPFSIYFGFYHIAIFYVSILISYIVWYVLEPTKESVLKEILPSNYYRQGISIVQGAWQVGLLLSAVVAGLIIDIVGVHEAILFSSFTYILAAILFLLIKRNLPEKSNEEVATNTHFIKDIFEGWNYLLNKKEALFFVLTTSMVLPFFYAINALIAPFNYQVLEGTGVTLGIIDSGAGIGSLISAFFCTLLGSKVNISKLLISSVLFLALVTLAFGINHTFIFAILLYIAIGFFIGNVKILSRTYVFDLIDEKFIGRIMTVITLLSLSLSIGVSLITSYIADKNIVMSYGIVAFMLIFPFIFSLMGVRKVTKTQKSKIATA